MNLKLKVYSAVVPQDAILGTVNYISDFEWAQEQCIRYLLKKKAKRKWLFFAASFSLQIETFFISNKGFEVHSILL